MLSQGTALILPCLLLTIHAGCSFKNQMDSTQSMNKDLDAAKFAAKMALAHKGLDIETLKKRQASIDNETMKRREDQEKAETETYIPHYVSSVEEGGSKPEKNTAEFDGDIWELAGRSNGRNPRQDLGEIKRTEL